MQKHLGVAQSRYIFSPNLPVVVATCYLLYLQHRRTSKVDLLAIEAGNNMTIFFVYLNM